MRHSILAIPALLIASACVEVTTPEPAAKVRLTASITDTNTCTVNLLGKTYSSANNVAGDLPSRFVGTVRDASYHGFGCWVGTSDGDGTIVVLFSGNNFGKPLEVGTYKVGLEVLDDTPAHVASVSFGGSHFGGHKMRTTDDSAGTVIVEATPSGGRRITIDVEVVRWGPIF